MAELQSTVSPRNADLTRQQPSDVAPQIAEAQEPAPQRSEATDVTPSTVTRLAPPTIAAPLLDGTGSLQASSTSVPQQQQPMPDAELPGPRTESASPIATAQGTRSALPGARTDEVEMADQELSSESFDAAMPRPERASPPASYADLQPVVEVRQADRAVMESQTFDPTQPAPTALSAPTGGGAGQAVADSARDRSGRGGRSPSEGPFG